MLRQLQQQIVTLQAQLAAMSSAASAVQDTSVAELHAHSQVRLPPFVCMSFKP